jgi:hypothetical protein
MSEYGSLGEALIEAAREMVAIHRGELEPTRVTYRVMTGPDADLTSPPFYSGRRVRQIRTRWASLRSVSPR